VSFPQQNWTNIVRSAAHFVHNVSVSCLCSLRNFGSVSFLSHNKENQLFLPNPWLFEFWSEHSFLLFRWRRRHNGRTVVLCNQTPTFTRYSAHKSSSVVVSVPTRYRTEKDCTELKTVRVGNETLDEGVSFLHCRSNQLPTVPPQGHLHCFAVLR